MRCALALVALAATSAGGNELKDFLPSASLSAANPADASLVDWSRVDPGKLHSVTDDDVKLLTACAGWTPTIANAFNPSSAKMLTSECLHTIPPRVFASLSAAHLKHLSSSSGPGLSAEQVALLPPSKCAAFAESEMFSQFTLAICSGVTADCLLAMPRERRAVLKTDACRQHAAPAAQDVLDATPAIPQSAVAVTAVVTVSTQSYNAVHAAGGTAVDRMTIAQAKLLQQQHTGFSFAAAGPTALTDSVVKSAASCAGFTATDWAALDVKAYSHMGAECFKSIPGTAFAGIPAAALAAMPTEVVGLMSNEQMGGMDAKVCAMFAMTEVFEALPVAICSAVPLECARLAPKAFEESRDCATQIAGFLNPQAQEQGGGAAVHALLGLNVVTDLLPAAAVVPAATSEDGASAATLVDWDKVPPAVFAKFTADALRFVTNCGTVTDAQIAQIPKAALAGVHAECVSTLPPATFAALSKDQLDALPATAAAAVTSGQLAGLSLAQCARVAASKAFASVAACGGLTAGCVLAMPHEVAAGLATREGCSAKLSPAAHAAVQSAASGQPISKDAAAAARPAFVPAKNVDPIAPDVVDWASVNATLFVGLLEPDMALLVNCSGLSTAQLTNIPHDSLAALKPSCLATLPLPVFYSLTAKQMKSMAPETMRDGATMEQLTRLSAATCADWFSKSSTATAFSQITPAQEAMTTCVLAKQECSGVTPAQLATVDAGLINALSLPCFASLPEGSFQALAPDQLNHLGAVHAAAVTDEQLGWLTPAQCEALGGGDFVKYQSGEACSGLTASCVERLSLSAAKYLVGQQTCFNHIPVPVQKAIPARVIEGLGMAVPAAASKAADVAESGSCTAMTGDAVAQLSAKEAVGLSAACVRDIPPAGFAAMSSEVLRRLSKEAGAVVTREQLGAVPAGTCAAFDGSSFFKSLSPAACAGLTPACVAALSLEGFKSIVTEACFAELPSAARLAMTPDQVARLATRGWYLSVLHKAPVPSDATPATGEAKGGAAEGAPPAGEGAAAMMGEGKAAEGPAPAAGEAASAVEAQPAAEGEAMPAAAAGEGKAAEGAMPAEGAAAAAGEGKAAEGAMPAEGAAAAGEGKAAEGAMPAEGAAAAAGEGKAAEGAMPAEGAAAAGEGKAAEGAMPAEGAAAAGEGKAAEGAMPAEGAAAAAGEGKAAEGAMPAEGAAAAAAMGEAQPAAEGAGAPAGEAKAAEGGEAMPAAEGAGAATGEGQVAAEGAEAMAEGSAPAGEAKAQDGAAAAMETQPAAEGGEAKTAAEPAPQPPSDAAPVTLKALQNQTQAKMTVPADQHEGHSHYGIVLLIAVAVGTAMYVSSKRLRTRYNKPTRTMQINRTPYETL